MRIIVSERAGPLAVFESMTATKDAVESIRSLPGRAPNGAVVECSKLREVTESRCDSPTSRIGSSTPKKRYCESHRRNDPAAQWRATYNICRLDVVAPDAEQRHPGARGTEPLQPTGES